MISTSWVRVGVLFVFELESEFGQIDAFGDEVEIVLLHAIVGMSG